jgi:hypothetical protein
MTNLIEGVARTPHLVLPAVVPPGITFSRQFSPNRAVCSAVAGPVAAADT